MVSLGSDTFRAISTCTYTPKPLFGHVGSSLVEKARISPYGTALAVFYVDTGTWEFAPYCSDDARIVQILDFNGEHVGYRREQI